MSIESVYKKLGISDDQVAFYGKDKAKVNPPAELANHGKLILVSAITPTPAGEGKTTMSIALAQGLKAIGKRPILALRQPSMGPVFGRKGGATGGGACRLTPSDDINLHFTGDFHAITAAHNLIAATIDNAIHFKKSRIDPLRVVWKRVMDMNDRALRQIVIGLGGRSHGGTPRESGFDITAASEIMAILCLSESFRDLRNRLDRMLIGYDQENKPVLCAELKITNALLAILKDAMQPNLVQSVDGVPAFVHGGPFANIAHGCNSLLATKLALHYGEYAVTEAGFAFDLGGEKFLNIKANIGKLDPCAIMIVATARAIKMHGGVNLKDLSLQNLAAIKSGLENLAAHIESAKFFNRPIIVAINQRDEDHPSELASIKDFCQQLGVACSRVTSYRDGAQGAIDLAEKIVAISNNSLPQSLPRVYSNAETIIEKVTRIATTIYRADGVHFSDEALKKVRKATEDGFGELAICMAKTQNSISDNPQLLGRPKNFKIQVRDIQIASGAGFIVCLTGEIVRMPGLPESPAAERITCDDDGILGNLL
jgi:formate--tetrahydrofolate ligase